MRNFREPGSLIPVLVLIGGLSSPHCGGPDKTQPPDRGSVSQGLTCPTVPDLYSAIQTGTAVPPHAVFCGNGAKSPIPSQVGQTPPLTPPGDSPGGRCADGSGQVGTYAQGCCISKATDGAGHRPAVEKVEIRGTVFGNPERYEDDGNNHMHVYEEYILYVQLDLNWDASPCLPSGVTPINSLAALSSALTPLNVIQMGGETQYPANGWAYGGPGSLIIKIEVDGWHLGGGIPTTGSPSRNYGPPPPGWNPGPDPRVSWVFDPDNPPSEPAYSDHSLQAGDYVRLVGTLWEDSPHDTSGAAGCWAEGFTSGRGYFEIHPVDYMARVHPVPSTAHGSYSASNYSVLTLCDDASVTSWEVMAPSPAPAAGATVGYEPIVVGDFTTLAHVNPPLSVETLPDRIRVSVGAQDWNDGFLGLDSHEGRFMGLFRVFWKLPPPPPQPLYLTVTPYCTPASGQSQVLLQAPWVAPPVGTVFKRWDGSSWVQLNTEVSSSDGPTYFDTTAAPGTTNYYQVCNRDAALQETCGTPGSSYTSVVVPAANSCITSVAAPFDPASCFLVPCTPSSFPPRPTGHFGLVGRVVSIISRANYYYSLVPSIFSFTSYPLTGLKCLDVPNGDYSGGNGVNLFPCHLGANQKWIIRSNSYTAGNWPDRDEYTVSPVGNPNLCLDIRGGTTHGGEALQIYPCAPFPTSSDNQRFSFPGQFALDSSRGVPFPKIGTYPTTSPNPDQCLDLWDQNGNGTLGQVQQWPCVYNNPPYDDQQWILYDWGLQTLF